MRYLYHGKALNFVCKIEESRNIINLRQPSTGNRRSHLEGWNLASWTGKSPPTQTDPFRRHSDTQSLRNLPLYLSLCFHLSPPSLRPPLLLLFTIEMDSPLSSPTMGSRRRKARSSCRRIDKLCCTLATYFPLLFVYSAHGWALYTYSWSICLRHVGGLKGISLGKKKVVLTGGLD